MTGYRGGGGNICREKLQWEKFCPKFRDSIFPAFLRVGTEFFLANLRIVEFYLHKDSNYRQNPLQKFPALRAGLYIFPIQLDGTEFFPGKIRIGTEFFPAEFLPDRIFPGQSPPPPGSG